MASTLSNRLNKEASNAAGLSSCHEGAWAKQLVLAPTGHDVSEIDEPPDRNTLHFRDFRAGMKAITTDPVLMLLIINVLLLVVGIMLEPLPAMIIFLPVLLPLASDVGLDPIHFGAVAVINIMIGMLTPPVGILLFVATNIGKIPLTQVFREVLPFVGWSLVVLLMLIVYPPLTTWLPSQL